ncbi:tetratricopeptide repeat protein [Actinosynnema sp. NPDC047251]|uniref:tetratricopeptide repeat protein n=1 Tax=Saccharothrix espanaensis TaxID=103731 RepID=UPI000301FF76|nr:tetratricopeptide repeat protein [Saccharothrix espanaensis]
MVRSDLLCAFQVLGADVLPVRVLAVGADVDLWQIDDTLAAREPTGPLHAVDGGRFAVRPALSLVARPRDDRAVRVARRIGDDFLVALDTCRDVVGGALFGFDHEPARLVLPAVGFADRAAAKAWLSGHRDLLAAAVRACCRAGCHDLSVALAARIWALPAPDPDLEWAHEVSRWGAESAIEARRPDALAGLLAAGARWFADAGDFVTAELHGIRESRTRRRIGAPFGIADALWRRAAIYRRWGRPHFALDCYRELAADYQEQGDRQGSARASAATGVTLLESRRPEAATEQFEQALRLYDRVSGAPPAERASVLEHLGRALWALGEHGTALRRLDQALSLLAHVDEPAADRIRRLRADLER